MTPATNTNSVAEDLRESAINRLEVIVASLGAFDRAEIPIPGHVLCTMVEQLRDVVHDLNLAEGLD